MVQRPTCTGVRVRSVADCNVIFHAVSQGVLPLVSRRLSIEERRAIYSGCVFVWEERTPTVDVVGDGLERWTDSRRWGASRLTKDFLFYQEKLPEVGDAALFAAMYQNRLIKQTYSVFVETPEGRRKWHLVAYCSPETGHQLFTIDDVPELSSLRHSVPEGKYQPARYSKTRARADGEPDDHNSGAALIDFPVQCTQPYQPTPPPVVAPLLTPEPTRRTIRLPIGLRLPSAPPPPRRDPDWILGKGVMISDVRQTHNRTLLGPEKAMAPLVYVGRRRYSARHPLDNEALRALASAP
ncbi:hypothetical protein PHLGIDRAFT_32392 [Phlebiopsis gigantea 11061_1 CR5-6]|uniref:Uncharacterized protein n=1 Tax=Phlebiopsis gigantea (strain 11061_1 CR5-6) TaxID=745531 RepID=A0A0C3NBP5_PHLG1|nr:hypothetical protein PHLGIDRAFT_32392 [Phlebiopsis gigantea 11061_1 CR5-6]